MAAKILVADDSITIQKIVALAFENEDVIVEGIGNGDEALTRLKSFKPNVVLADIDMPGLTGFELSRKIKESSALQSIHVLLLTNDFEEFDENLFQTSLANNHITKPFKSEDLVKKVMTLLKDDSSIDKVMAAPEDDSPIKENDETEDEETEFVIELSQADRVDNDVVMDLGEEPLIDTPTEPVNEDIDLGEELPIVDSLAELVSEQDDVVLDLSPDEDDDVVLDLSPDPEPASVEGDVPEVFSENTSAEIEELEIHPVLSDPLPNEDLLPEISASDQDDLAEDETAEQDDPTEDETMGQEEDLDELLLKVEELSRQSVEISGNGTSDELSPLEAIDEMMKEVSALKEEAFAGSPDDENISTETTEPQLSAVPTVNGLGFGEIDYVSEENADLLATAFDEITHENTVTFSTTDDRDESSEPFFQEDAEENSAGGELENLTEEFSEHFLSTPEKEPAFEETSFHASSQEPSAPTEITLTTDNGGHDSHIEKPQEPTLPGDSQLNQLMEKEVMSVLQQSLTPLIEKEISGLSEKILLAVEKNVRQVTPGIAKMIIEKEIDKIKTMENG
jgi:DNA-binding response OmpR family regulator